MTREEKYKRILFILTEAAVIGKNDKVTEIFDRLSTWRYTIVNSPEGQSEEEWKFLEEYCLNKVIEIL